MKYFRCSKAWNDQYNLHTDTLLILHENNPCPSLSSVVKTRSSGQPTGERQAQCWSGTGYMVASNELGREIILYLTGYGVKWQRSISKDKIIYLLWFDLNLNSFIARLKSNKRQRIFSHQDFRYFLSLIYYLGLKFGWKFFEWVYRFLLEIIVKYWERWAGRGGKYCVWKIQFFPLGPAKNDQKKFHTGSRKALIVRLIT